jgi:hypothetical protein
MGLVKAFDSKDAELELLGAKVAEFTISYSVSESSRLNKSAGSRKPTSYSNGDEEYTCTLMLGMADQVAIEAAARKAGHKSILTVPMFPAVVSYLNPDQVLVQDVIQMKFQSNGRSVGENDTLRYEHTMLVGDIEFSKPL